MRSTPEVASPNQSLRQRLIRAGSYTGAVLASALMIGESTAAASMDSASPKGNIPTRTSEASANGQYIPYPPELNYNDVIHSHDQVRADTLEAMAQKQEQWNGVLVIHEPTKHTDIGPTDSPRGYSFFSDPNWIFGGPNKNFAKDNSAQLVISDYYLIESKVGKHKRLFAEFYSTQGLPAFLDIKYGVDMGALTFYAYNNSSPKALPIGESTKMPRVDYEDKGRVLDNKSVDSTFIDSHGKVRHAHLSNVVPHM